MHWFNRNTMRKIAVALMILCSLMVVPNSIGQIPTPTAAISLNCDSDPFQVSHLYVLDEHYYEIEFDPHVENQLVCNLNNPTAYDELVELTYSISNDGGAISLIANDVDYNNSSVLIEVENNSERNFSLSLNINEDIRFHTEPYSTFQLSITVSVTEINGLPPANSASSTVYTQIMTRDILAGSRLGLNVNPSVASDYTGFPLNGQLYNGNSWSDYDYSGMFDSPQNLPFLEPWTVIQFTDIEGCSYCILSAEEITEYSYQYDYNNNTNQQPDVRFIANAANIVNDTNTQNTRAEIESFRMDYQHNLIDYIDDLSNVNMDEWDIYGIPWLYLIQPDGTFAWDPVLYPQVGWDEAERRPVVLEDCVIGATGPPLPVPIFGGATHYCDLSDAIDILVDVVDLEPVKGEVSMQIYHGESLEDALSMHTIAIELDGTAAPMHVDNFIKHVEAGNYDGAIFHRIIDDFMIQGGDFQNGVGTGGYAYQWYGYCDGQKMNNSDDCSDPTLYTLPDEADNGLNHLACMISMAKTSAPNTGGSQFFIMPDDITHHTWLDGAHTVFGEVTSGCESITMLSEVETGQNDRPTIPVVIHSATVVSYPGFDTDGDGVIDAEDDFPDNPDETNDSDGDGVGDNADEFPFDANETHDDDGDGVGNNTDAFPQDGNETHDDDGDGVGNNTDAFPQDANETMDTDGDGVGDNADPAPEDPTISSPADLEVNVSDTSAYLIAGSIVFLALVIIFVRRRPPTMQASDKYSEHAYQESLFNEN